MSEQIDDGGNAFPDDCEATGPSNYNPGMSLRDYFAGQAMIMLGSEGVVAAYKARDGERNASLQAFAGCAYIYADAMIAERNKEKKG